jgi:ppGpp synthetase/RelA/SpoT-type nucleotidyltranferase
MVISEIGRVVFGLFAFALGVAMLVWPQWKLHVTEAGVRHTIQFRVKEFASFVRKALTKNLSDPLRDIHDLAGVRVVVPFYADRARAAEVIRRHFEVRDEEDTSARQAANQFGYRGWHFQIALKHADLAAKTELIDQVAELQVQTRAESAWAEAGHDLVYKPRAAVPAPTQRRIARLMAIVELFDEQMGTTQTELLAVPGFSGGWNVGSAGAGVPPARPPGIRSPPVA